MKYFFDTEFIEGTQKRRFGRQTKPTIDLISIGIVDENGREFYAISNEFNLKEAWNRFDIKKDLGKPQGFAYEKVYWIRENVLKPIFTELFERFCKEPDYKGFVSMEFNFENLQYLIKKYGYCNRAIANYICAFIYGDDCGGSGESPIEMAMKYEISDKTKEPEFYAYYCGYDWVAFCWLFGKMISLPKGFPMYCKDLKQTMDEFVETCVQKKEVENFKDGLFWLKHLEDYPTQDNEHNALDDAKWNLKLYKLLNSLKN